MTFPENLGTILRRNAAAFSKILDQDLNAANVCQLDFTAANAALERIDLRDTATFERALQQQLAACGAAIGIGGYLEDRFIYRRSPHFDVASESRNLHLGIDVWLPAGAAVYAPLNATVHSFRDNAGFGDYGPTIILQHELEGTTFYTLYGHLSRTSITGLEPGSSIGKGIRIATVGPYPENGDWPPHLHFQVMASMEGMSGDFPGVATTAERAKYTLLCPDPNLILQCRHLEFGSLGVRKFRS